jgi:hypothetical protein
VSTYTTRYVKGCEKCQRTKLRQGPLAAPLQPHNPPPHPWHTISMDLIRPLPKSKGHDAIFVVVDKLTKMTKMIPTSTAQNSIQTAELLRDHIFRSFGIPKKVISDRGPQFVSNFMTEFYKMIKVETNPSSAYHPQTDGQTEQENAEIEKYLRTWVNDRQDDWVDWLTIAEFTLNNWTSHVTGFSPFQLNYRRNPNTGMAPRRTRRNESTEDFTQRMEDASMEAQKAIKLANTTMKNQVNCHRKPA